MTVRRTSLDEQALPPVPSTVEERLALVEILTRESWALAGLPLPRYARSRMPIRIARLGDVADGP